MKEEEEGREKVHTTIRSVLSRKTNIAIITGWIITGIAIASVWIWAMSSPMLETLVSMNISIGLATIMGIFNVTLKVVDRISGMETVLVRIETLLRET